MALIFDRINRLIIVPITQTEIGIQALINEIRVYEALLHSMDLLQMLKAYGKQDLSGGLYVGITMELLDNWRIKFADRLGPNFVQCSISGGNIVAYDSSGVQQHPLESSNFVFATIIGSSSATLIEGISQAYIANAVWDNSALAHTNVGSMGEIMNELPSGLKRGEKVDDFEFTIADENGLPAIGAIVTPYISKDGATFIAMTNVVAEIGYGMYCIDITAIELDCDTAGLVFISVDNRQTNIGLVTT